MHKKIEISLLVLSSFLLGIWAVRDTIALRNMLLIFGFILAIFYVCTNINGEKIRGLVGRFMLVFLTLIFLWVVFHYLFLSKYLDIQWGELRSTWLRTFGAVIIGVGTGIALNNRIRNGFILCAGVALSFCIVLIQYIKIAIENKKIFFVDYDAYIYIGKINAVLMGIILISLILGIMLDKMNCRRDVGKRTSTAIFLVFLMVVYSYVNIFDTRNGLGLSILIFLAFGALALYILAKYKIKVLAKSKFTYAVVLALILFLGSMIKLQIERKSSWEKLISDGKIAIQIDNYQNWKNPSNLGYPVAKDGTMVDISNYERIAWARAGMDIVVKNPLGLGILEGAFQKQIDSDIKIGRPSSTHSGWLDLSLSFGLPFLILVSSLIALIMYSAISTSNDVKYLSIVLCIAMTLTYLVGELGDKHAVEILFFQLGLLVGLQAFVKAPIISWSNSFRGSVRKI